MSPSSILFSRPVSFVGAVEIGKRTVFHLLEKQTTPPTTILAYTIGH